MLEMWPQCFNSTSCRNSALLKGSGKVLEYKFPPFETESDDKSVLAAEDLKHSRILAAVWGFLLQKDKVNLGAEGLLLLISSHVWSLPELLTDTQRARPSII